MDYISHGGQGIESQKHQQMNTLATIPKIQDRLRDYSGLFSRREVMAWMRGDFRGVNPKIERYDRKWVSRKERTYLDYFKYIYDFLRTDYCNEYVFKNEFLTDWLLDELGKEDSRVFNEFRVGDNVADLVMFNGISKAFEIKTEYDSDNRLSSQIEAYQKVFNEVYLIIPDFKIPDYKNYRNEIGIITFSKEKGRAFELYRTAALNQEVNSEVVMNILHTKEYKQLVKTHFGSLPDMNSFNQYVVCFDLLKMIPNYKLNELFISVMKQRRSDYRLKKNNHREFNQIRLSLNLSSKDESILFQHLKSPIII